MTPAERIRYWRDNPVAMAFDEFKFTPDPAQEEFLRKLPSQDPDEKRMALQACTGAGKTAVLAIANLHFVGTHGKKGQHPKGLCTSITEDNLRGNLWPELSVWQQRSEFFKRAFKWTATRFSSVDHPETWFIEARNWSKRADPKQLGRTLSGLHAPFVMVTIDECGDVPVPVLQSGEQIFSSKHEWAKLLLGGNPTSHNGALYHAATTPGWLVIRITGDPENAKRSPRIDIENAKRQIKLYGREDPWVMATILGEFPPGSIQALLDLNDVQKAIDRNLKPDTYSWAQKRLGADVSRYGDDPTILFPRQGLRAGLKESPCVTMRHPRGSAVSVDIANRIMLARQRWGWEVCTLDGTGGWAAGARDILVSSHLGNAQILSIQYHAPAPDPRYYNMRAYMAWQLAQWVKDGGWLPPNCPNLVKQLTEVTYGFKQGKLLLEDKDQVKARIGMSPNEMDALMQTFALPDMPSNMEEGLKSKLQQSSGRTDADFDPYERDRARSSDWDPNAGM
jgi:phage terminase large subunit